MSQLRLCDIRADGFGPLSLTLHSGTCACLTGPSGAGKTRLLRCAVDLDLHQGEAWLDERERRSFAPWAWRRAVGMLPAESQWWLPTAGAHLRDPDPSWLADLGLAEPVLSRPIAQLSSGERQRLALLRLLCNRPAVLLLDEPTGHLDAANTARVETLVNRYRREAGAAVLWITHEAAQAERLGGPRLRITDGRIEDWAA